MDAIAEIILPMGTLEGVLLLVIGAVLTVLLPVSAYAAQKWAYRTFQETREINKKLDEMLRLARHMLQERVDDKAHLRNPAD